MPSAVVGQAVPGAVADEEDAVLDRRRAAGGGSSCPGSPRARTPTSAASRTRRLLDVVARVERADADAHLVVGRERPAVAGARRTAGRATARGRRRRPCGWTSRPRDRRASGGWIGSGALESTRRQPSASTISGARQVAAVGVDDVSPVRRVDLRGLELARPATARAAARRGGGSRTSRTSTAASSGSVAPRRVDDEVAERLVDRRPSSPRLRSHSVGAAHALVWRSPIS